MDPVRREVVLKHIHGLDSVQKEKIFEELLYRYCFAKSFGTDDAYRTTFNGLTKFIGDFSEFKDRFPFIELPNRDEDLPPPITFLEFVNEVPCWQIPLVCCAFAIVKVQDVFSSVYNSANSTCSKIFRCRRPERSI